MGVCVFGACIVLLVFLTLQAAPVQGHSLFNSAEEFIGGYRVQIATLPEFPQIGEDSQILLRVTDAEFAEVDDFTVGTRFTYNGDQILATSPTPVEGSHWEMSFVFERPGNHIVYVDLYDTAPGKILTYTFNIGTQSPFGYIFFIAITIGAVTFAIVVGYIYLPRILAVLRR